MNFLRAILPKPIKDLLRPIYFGGIDCFRAIVRAILWLLRSLLGARLYLRTSQFIRRESNNNLTVSGIKFDATDYIPLHRATTILTKEPDTIAWINDCIEAGEVLYDIGANIGVFSLYAAKFKKARVISFEPFAGNYATLNRNIYLNGFSDLITALNIALHKETILSNLNVSEFWTGKAGHSFDKPIGSVGDVFTPKFLQGVIGMSLDEFILSYDVPFPNHIKIDVDGNEPLVVEGMKKTLCDLRLKSVAIEINNDLPEHVKALEEIKSAGLEVLKEDKYINHAYLAVSSTQNYFLTRRLNKT